MDLSKTCFFAGCTNILAIQLWTTDLSKAGRSASLVRYKSTCRGGGGKLCHFFAFKCPVGVLLSLQVSDLAQPKIHISGHIMCEFWLHGTAVEMTVGDGKTKNETAQLAQTMG